MRNLLLLGTMALLVGAASPSEIKAAAPGLNPKELAHMDYFLARKVIVKDGWRPVSGPCEQVSEEECARFPEIDACSGVSPGYCGLDFVKGDRCLYVTTAGGEPESRKRTDVHVEEAVIRPGPCEKN